MWKPILAGTAALVLAGSSLVYAQNRPGREGPQQWRPNVEDMRAFGEARLAALKAGLALKPEQEKNWPAFEQAAREFGRLRVERMASAHNAAAATQPVDPAERMLRRATALTETGAALKKLGDATAPLYNSLDEGQKRRFAILSRFTGPDGQANRGRERGPRAGQRGMHRTDAEGSDHAYPMQHPMSHPKQHRMSPAHGKESL